MSRFAPEAKLQVISRAAQGYCYLLYMLVMI